MLAASPQANPVLVQALVSSLVALLQTVDEDVRLDALMLATPSLLAWLQVRLGSLGWPSALTLLCD
jgi:hypothetical protein